MSERQAKKRREGMPKLTQEAVATIDCINFIETRISGRPMVVALTIIADAVAHLLASMEMQAKLEPGAVMRQFGTLMTAMADTLAEKGKDMAEEPVEETEADDVAEPESKPALAVAE